MQSLSKTITKSYGEGPWHSLSFEIILAKGLTHWEVWERRMWWRPLEIWDAPDDGGYGRDEVRRLIHYSKHYDACLPHYDAQLDRQIIHQLFT